MKAIRLANYRSPVLILRGTMFFFERIEMRASTCTTWNKASVNTYGFTDSTNLNNSIVVPEVVSHSVFCCRRPWHQHGMAIRNSSTFSQCQVWHVFQPYLTLPSITRGNLVKPVGNPHANLILLLFIVFN